MKKIVLTAAALMIAAGSAYAAGSGQSIQVPGNSLTQSAVDTTTTSSVVKDLLNGGSAGNHAGQYVPTQNGDTRDMWGNH